MEEFMNGSYSTAIDVFKNKLKDCSDDEEGLLLTNIAFCQLGFHSFSAYR